MSVAVECDALYYPYIHIDDVHWLKATLLCFPHVHRMVPFSYRGGDAEGLEQFRQVTGLHEKPLLIEQTTTGSCSYQAQLDLLKKLKFHYKPLCARYSIEVAQRLGKELYPIHVDKMPIKRPFEKSLNP